MTAEERNETKTWEQFCREQARESATRFFDKVRRFKERNPSTSDIHDSVFANEFSAAFLEESVTMFRSSGMMNGLSVSNGVSRTMTMSRQGQRKGGSPHTKSGGRAWWNIFKWTKFSRAESASKKSPVAGAADTHGVVLLEGVVDLLNMKDSMQTLVWQQCRLVLLQQQGHHQLEVFYPPKVRGHAHTAKLVLQAGFKKICDQDLTISNQYKIYILDHPFPIVQWLRGQMVA